MDIFQEAEQHVRDAQAEFNPVKTYILFSGGNDSTILLHHMWHAGLADAAVHINTGIGIEQTRVFVRDLCKQYDIPLIEKHPGKVTYEDLILNYFKGFPGPAAHRFCYIHLKDHAIRELVREAKTSYWDKVLLINGQRKSESARRMRNVQDVIFREGAQVWCAPYIDVTKAQLVGYRREHNVPENEVAALLHMSGECLCGAFAKEGELDDIALWYPETAEYIRDLERRVAERGYERCTWGYGARLKKPAAAAPGPLCSDCGLS